MDVNKDRLAAFVEFVWNQGNIDAIDDFLADEYTILHDPGDPWDQQTLSIEEFKDRVSSSRAPFPDQRFEIQHLVAEDDAVTIAWLWSGTHSEDASGFTASGKVIEMSGLTMYFFDGDRICGHWQVTDRLSVYQQLMANQASEPTS